MLASVSFVAILLAIFFIGSSSGASKQLDEAIVLQNATLYSYSYNASIDTDHTYTPQLYALGIPSNISAPVEDFLLLVGIQLRVFDDDWQPIFDGSLSLLVTTSNGVSLGVTEIEGPFNLTTGQFVNQTVMFCWSNDFASEPPEGYIIQVLPPASASPVDGSTVEQVNFLNDQLSYVLFAALIQRELSIDGPEMLDTLPLLSTYWFFDVNETKRTETRPLELTIRHLNKLHGDDTKLNSGKSRRHDANLVTVFYGCPGQLTAGRQNAIRPTATGTFDKQIRITFSKGEGAAALRSGRFFIVVDKPTEEMSWPLQLHVTEGMPYSEYSSRWGLTILTYMLVCPAICAITFFLIWYAQPLRSRTIFGPQDSLLPEGAYDESSSDSDDILDEEGSTDKDGLVATVPATDAFQTLTPVTGVRFWETTLLVFLIFFTPAIQILMSELLKLGEWGDWDTCYYNDLCLRPSYEAGLLIFAFNSVFSNIGYVIAGFTVFVYLILLRRYVSHLPRFMPTQYSVLWALCLCLVAVGINSAVYHFCPSRIGFQVDSAQMLAFALLSIADIYRRNFDPKLESWTVFMVLAVLLLLNYIGTIIDTYPTIDEDARDTANLVYLGVLTILLSLALLAFVVWIWWFNPHVTNRRSFVVLALVLGLPNIALLWWRYDEDLSQTLLAIFVVMYALCVAADFAAQLGFVALIERCELPRVCRICPSGTGRSCLKERSFWRRVRTSILIVWLTAGWLTCGIVSLIYFAWKEDTDKNQTPAESRNLNSPCVLSDYYSTHDIWHLVSATWLMFQVLINAHIGHGLKNSRLFFFKDEVKFSTTPTVGPPAYGTI